MRCENSKLLNEGNKKPASLSTCGFLRFAEEISYK
jgi:hypothetical protein